MQNLLLLEFSPTAIVIQNPEFKTWYSRSAIQIIILQVHYTSCWRELQQQQRTFNLRNFCLKYNLRNLRSKICSFTFLSSLFTEIDHPIYSILISAGSEVGAEEHILQWHRHRSTFR